MINHYFTLIKLKEELKPIFIGTELAECFSQEKNSLTFIFTDGNNEYTLFYTILENKPIIFLNNNFKRARKNTINLFQHLNGARLQDINIHHNNRIIEFTFLDYKLIFHIFTPGNSNIYLINLNSNTIIDLFKKKKEFIGKELLSPIPTLKKIDEFNNDDLIFDHITKSELLLNKIYCNELFHKLNLDEKLKFKDLNENHINHILKKASELKDDCLKSNEFYVYDYDNSKLLSLIPLTHVNSDCIKFNKINEALKYRFKFSKINLTLTTKKKELINKFEKKLQKLNNKIINFINENSSIKRIQDYRKWAELLIAYPIHKNKKLEKITLIDFDGNEIEIPLNIKKTLIENANDYFTKAKNIEKELSKRKIMLPTLQNELKTNENILNSIKEAKSIKELEKIMNDFEIDFGLSVENKTETKFRKFDLGEGFTLYVGKNAANNYELTMKFARPNDLWFHARGAGGSHAILRLNKGQKAPKNIIKKAASIVAYYSQAKKSKFVPVVYTYRKYVRKPKGAEIGSVTISKEEVIMVEPSLPY